MKARPRRQTAEIIGALLAVLIIAAIFAGAFAIRAGAPCWMFSTAEAPVRCLPGAVR